MQTPFPCSSVFNDKTIFKRYYNSNVKLYESFFLKIQGALQMERGLMMIMIITVKIDDNNDIYWGIIWESSTGVSTSFFNVLLKEAFRCYCHYIEA